MSDVLKTVDEEYEEIKKEWKRNDYLSIKPYSHRTLLPPREIGCLKIGDHVAWHRPCVIWHHAIVSEVGKEKINVIHFHSSSKFRKMTIIEESLDLDAIFKDDFFRIHYSKCDLQDQVLKRAKALVGVKGYSISSKNCEHFATFCKKGKKFSGQVDSAITNGLKRFVLQGSTVEKGIPIIRSVATEATFYGRLAINMAKETGKRFYPRMTSASSSVVNYSKVLMQSMANDTRFREVMAASTRAIQSGGRYACTLAREAGKQCYHGVTKALSAVISGGRQLASIAKETGKQCYRKVTTGPAREGITKVIKDTNWTVIVVVAAIETGSAVYDVYKMNDMTNKDFKKSITERVFVGVSNVVGSAIGGYVGSVVPGIGTSLGASIGSYLAKSAASMAVTVIGSAVGHALGRFLFR